jgi:hypothetical protein
MPVEQITVMSAVSVDCADENSVDDAAGGRMLRDGRSTSVIAEVPARRLVAPTSVPEAVNLTVVAGSETSSSLDLTWEEPTGIEDSEFQSYTIKYRAKEDSTEFEWDIVRTGSDLTELKLEGLSPSTAYEVTIAAENDIGEGAFSSPFRERETLGEKAPDEVLFDESATVKTTSSITLKWVKPTTCGGLGTTCSSDINEYVIQYRKHGTQEPWSQVTTPGDSVTFEVANLAAGTKYEFRGAAKNEEGLGKYTPSDKHEEAETMDATEPVPSAPGQPEVLAKQFESLTIGWAKSTISDDLEIKYTVSHKLAGSVGAWSSSPPLDQYSYAQYQITGLSSGTTYELRVHASNTASPPENSESSAVAYGRTKGTDAPGQMAKLVPIAPVQQTSIRLALTAPTDIGDGPVTG